MQIFTMWLMYLVAALGCYWCWTKMFFWLENPVARLFAKWFGAVLLFSPAPATPGQQDYMPAFIIVVFRGLLDRSDDYFEALSYMSAMLVFGSLIITGYLFMTSLKAKMTESSSEG